MGHRRWLGLLIAFLGLEQLASARPQPLLPDLVGPQTQRRGTHYLPNDNPTDLKGFEAALQDRLNRARELHDVQKQLLDLLNNRSVLNKLKEQFKGEDIEKVRKQLMQNPDQLLNNPELRRLMSQLQSANGPRNSLSEKQVKNLAELMKQFQDGFSSHGPGAISDQLQNLPGDLGTGIDHKLPVPPQGDISTLPELAGGFDTSSSENGRSFEEFLNKTLTNWAENLDSLDYGAESGALRDAIVQLNRSGLGKDGMNLNLGPWKERLDFLPRFGDIFSRETLGTIGRVPSFRGFRPPRIHVPSFRSGPLWSPSMPSGPSVSVSEAGTGLVWVATAVLVMVLAWKGRDWYREVQAARNQAAWQPGAWPVDPGGVTTRGDLVRDFEYLALLCLGPTAGTRHHHDLADQLGRQGQDDGSARRQAAAQLASLYEQARYAPETARPDEPLSEPDRSVARQALCFLAGVTPA